MGNSPASPNRGRRVTHRFDGFGVLVRNVGWEDACDSRSPIEIEHHRTGPHAGDNDIARPGRVASTHAEPLTSFW